MVVLSIGAEPTVVTVYQMSTRKKKGKEKKIPCAH